MPGLLSVLCLGLASGCITGRPPLRSPEQLPVAVAFVEDFSDRAGVASVPPDVVDSVASSLQSHNMTAHTVPFDSYSDDFNSRRLTAARLAALAAKAGDAQTLLLIETKASFYSELQDLFRWDVYSKATIAQAGKLNDAISREKTFPVFMDFEHEREPAVLAAAAPAIADQVDRLSSDFLGIVLPQHAALDRAPVPSSWDSQKESIYFVLVDRFANGDPSNDGDADPRDPQGFHGGDLQGVLNRLDYLQDLGVTTVWLSPIFKMRTAKLNGHGAFHGYWVEDFTKVEPRFGTEETLVKLSSELHRRGMKLLLDVVLNHVAYDAPLTRQHPEWFHHHGDIKDWNDPRQLETYDVHGLPDLAQERADVYQYLLNTSLYWIDRVHPDGFRLDAVKHIPLSFWARYNDDIRQHAGPGFLLLGEELDGDPQKIARTMREGHFTSMFDFPLGFALVDVFCRNDEPAKLAARLFQDSEYEHPERLATLLDNHDLPRVQTACGDAGRVEQAVGILMSARGIPTFTYGTEAGLEGTDDRSNRGDMRFAPESPLADEIRKLNRFRKEHPDVVAARCSNVQIGPGTFSCLRVADHATLVVGVNDGAEPLQASLGARSDDQAVPSGVDLLSGAAMTLASDGSSLFVTIPPRTTRLILVRRESRHPPVSAAAPTLVAFVLQDSGLPGGTTIFVTGAGKELGNWSPALAIGPFREHDGRLEARTSLPADGVFELKLIARGGDGHVRWESGPNHYVLAQAEIPVAWRDLPPPHP